MSKFIKVTEQACGEEKIIFTSSIIEIVRDEDKGSIVYYNDDSRFFTRESLEQIEAQLLRDEFAMRVASGLIAISSYADEQASNAYALADAMLKERLK